MGEPMNCQRRFRDGLVLCDPGDTGTFRRELFPSEQLRAIDINVGKPVCLENSNLYMLHFSAMFMQVGTFFLGYSPHDYHILGGSVPRLYTLVLL
jgi:hypothetical protein